MESNLNQVKTKVYDNCDLNISGFKIDHESKAYGACRFELNGRSILSRNAKITPRKVGQFVTVWKRNGIGPIEPFSVNDQIDFYAITVRFENRFGQFVFPKSILIKKGIISTENKEGKRAFRVYPKWDVVKNKQAERTQKWQLKYFYEIGTPTDFKRVSDLYGND